MSTGLSYFSDPRYYILTLPKPFIMVFGRKKAAPAPPPPPSVPQRTPQQVAREMTRQNNRTVHRVEREMARERLSLEAEEKRIMNEIKALSRQGRTAEARMLAKNLVQVRNAKSRTYQASTQANSIGTQARMAQADAAMMNVMGSTAAVMKNANQIADPDRQMKMLQEFDMESERYKLNQEMTDEVLDSVLGGSEVDEETDEVLNSVLDEIGLEVGGKMGEALTVRPNELALQRERLEKADDDELRNRIDKLGGGAM